MKEENKDKIDHYLTIIRTSIDKIKNVIKDEQISKNRNYMDYFIEHKMTFEEVYRAYENFKTHIGCEGTTFDEYIHLGFHLYGRENQKRMEDYTMSHIHSPYLGQFNTK